MSLLSHSSLPLSASPARSSRSQGIFLLTPDTAEQIYPPEVRAALAEQVDVVMPFTEGKDWRSVAAALAKTEILLTGWGAPVLDAEFLRHAPQLRAVFYGAGSVKTTVTDEFWQRKIPLVTAASANAIPVMEFALAQILLLLKDTYRFARTVRTRRTWVKHWPVAGAYRSTVGLVSLGAIGALLAERLRLFDVNVIAYDPFFDPVQAAALNVALVPLDELLARADVVSVHTPLLPGTRGMIGEAQLAKLKRGAGLVNTARGAVIDQAALTKFLQNREDVFAVLDVTWPQPPPPDSPLYDLPNVMITPHIAGSMYNECSRMGWLIVEEVRRFLAGQPLQFEIRQAMLPRRA